MVVTAPGTYTVIGTGANGCQAESSIEITQDITKPTVEIIPTATELTCDVTSISLVAAGADTYDWATGMIEVTAPGHYSVIGTNANGCSNVAEIEITQNIQKPSIAIQSQATEITCTTTEITLVANTTVNDLQWSNNVTGSGREVKVYDEGIYSIVVKDVNGCTQSAEVTITKNQTLGVSVTPESNTIKLGERARFDSTVEGIVSAYTWTLEDQLISSDRSITVTPTATGTYHYILTVVNGVCEAESEGVLEVIPADESVITSQPQDVVVKEGERAIFSVATSTENTTFQWYENGQAIAGATQATYIISSAAVAQYGNEYYCELDHFGTKVNSAIAHLYIAPNKPKGFVSSNDNPVVGDDVTYTLISPESDVTYTWFIDGEEVGQGTELSHTWSDAGVYDIEIVPSRRETEGETYSESVKVKPSTLNVEIEMLYPLETVVGSSLVYRIANPEDGISYRWEVTGGRVEKGQGGDIVSIYWEEAGNQTITVYPSKNFAEGDPVSFDIEVLEKSQAGNGGNGGNDNPATGIDVESLKEQIRIYPNPTYGESNIEMPVELDVMSASIYTISGAKIEDATISVMDGVINLSGKPAGVYMLQMTTNYGIITKFVIVR